MSRKQKKMLIRIIISFILLIATFLIPIENKYLQLIAALIPFIIIGYDILLKSARNILHGQIFDENFLMSIATIGSFVLGYFNGSGEYEEGIAVMLFYQVGEFFQNYAVGSSRKSIASLMDIRPDFANIEKNGEIISVDPEEVEIGSITVIKPGERIPLDGIIEEGSSSIDTSALTGESMPRDAAAGDSVISGCINLNGLLKVRTTKEYGESTVSKILDLVENSSSKKSKAENFITKFAKYYTPCVVFAALALAIIPSIITGDWAKWINRALIFLVISCPCALVISVPLSFFGGIGGASKSGILVKGGNYLEILSKAETIVFDKTGTLTKGVFKVTAVHPEKSSESQRLKYAAMAESFSNHTNAQSIRESYGSDTDSSIIHNYEEIDVRGIKCNINCLYN
ncbi:MAG: HAD-IC family P-type ATPase, partial [Oscillospiraceae bacterium]|nr:HAD-IC family P-type ATPase [Oscillospiraceae bacterium]